MKITILLLFYFVVINTCSAQISAGTSLIGGSASFSSHAGKSNSNQNDFYKSTTISYGLSPKGGYFIANNLAIGLGINYDNSKTKFKGDNQPNSSINRSFGVSPFGRYYKMLGERAGFFGQLSISYSQGTSKQGDFTLRKSNYFGAGVAPGFVFFATPKIGIETTIGSFGYWHSKNKNYDFNSTSSFENTSNQLQASLSTSSIFLGINLYLSR